MPALAFVRILQLFVAACLAVACSSGPALRRDLALVPGELTTVRLLAVKGSLALALQNVSAQQPADVYGRTSAEVDPGRKVVDDVNLQTLLDLFSEKGMFATALAEVPGDARDVLAVEQGRRRWIWALSGDPQRRLAQRQQGAERTFQEAQAEFLHLYNSSVGFHGTGEDRPDFRAENARARAEAERARVRLEHTKGRR
jgi:hypothetical protein